MHTKKDRRILEEKRHGGCAAGGERTAAQREKGSGRKGPQACVIAFSGHNPRRATGGTQHGIFGERSFRRLRYLAWNWTRYIGWPIDIVGPVDRQPHKSQFNPANTHISPSSYGGKSLSVVENFRRKSCFSEVRGFAVLVNNSEKRGECLHTWSICGTYTHLSTVYVPLAHNRRTVKIPQ